MKKERKVAAVVLVALLVFLVGFGLGTSKGISINVKVEGGAAAGSNNSTPVVQTQPATQAQPQPTQAPVADPTQPNASGDATTAAGAEADATTAGGAASPTGIPSSKEEVVAKYCEVINTAKKEQKISIKKIETVSLNCTECSVGFLKGIVNTALSALAKGGEWSWDFVDGKNADGHGPAGYIAPGGNERDCTLQASGVAEANATPSGDGYQMVIKLNPEKSTFDGTNTVNPVNNESCIDPLNLATLEIPISGASITAADMDYPGTTLTADVNGAGKITKLVVDLPMSGTGTGAIKSAALTVGIEGSLNDVYEFTY